MATDRMTTAWDTANDLIARLHDRDATIVVVGQGYVGLPLALRAAELGFAVIGYETSPQRVEALRNGESYIADVSDDDLGAGLDRQYRPTSDPDDLEGFDIVVISVPTPLSDGAPNMRHIEDAARVIGRHLEPGAAVILESTTYPGTTEEFLAPLLEESSGLARTEYHLGYSPERIDPGNREHTLVTTPKVTSGLDHPSLEVVDAFYSILVDTTVRVASPAEAELVKLLENTFRHVNIALVNELAMFARQLGVDIWGAIDAAATKPFGYMRFTPGPGVGGHCLPIDPSYLAWRVRQHLGQTFRFVELANDVNAHMPDYVFSRVTALLNDCERSVKGSRILLLGMAYKRNTSDWRESPSRELIVRLADAGARLELCDPFVPQTDLDATGHDVVSFSPEALANTDLVVVLVDHEVFDPVVIAAHAPLVFDAKNLMAGHSFSGEVL